MLGISHETSCNHSMLTPELRGCRPSTQDPRFKALQIRSWWSITRSSETVGPVVKEDKYRFCSDHAAG